MGKLIDSDELKARLKNLHMMAISGYGAEEVVAKVLDEMPEGVVRCRDCKYFDLDSWVNLGGVPIIVAHEACTKWGNGCRTSEDGYCFMAERKTDGL